MVRLGDVSREVLVTPGLKHAFTFDTTFHFRFRDLAVDVEEILEYVVREYANVGSA